MGMQMCIRDRIYHEHYHDINNIAWISRHLEGEAAIWWRLVKDSINNFAGFTEAFRISTEMT